MLINLVRFKVLVIELYILLKFVTVDSLDLGHLHPSINALEIWFLSWGLNPRPPVSQVSALAELRQNS